MADKEEKKLDAQQIRFRREAGLQILAAYVSKHGGFGNANSMEIHMRQVWDYADAFVRLEDAPPLPKPEVVPLNERELPKGRPAHPSDEWAVIDGDKRVGGFVTREDAEFYAAARPGARVKLISGPDLHRDVA